MEKNSAAEIFGPSLFNLLGDLFLVFDYDLVIKDVSPTSNKILGLSPSVLIHKNALDIIHPADKKNISNSLKKIQISKDGIIEEFIRFLCSDGTYKFIRLRATKHPFEADRIIAVGQDINEEYLQVYLMKSAETYAQLGSWQFDVKTGKRKWSRSVYDIFEVPLDLELTTEIVEKIYTPSGMIKVRQVLQDTLQTGKPWDFEQLMCTYTGKEKWIRTKGGPVKENGEIIFLDGVVQDIDLKKKEELALQDALTELDKVQQGINNHFIVSKISPEGIFLNVNQNFEALTGYHRSEIIGKHVTVLKSDLMTHETYEGIFKDLLANKKWRGEICHTKKNGEYYWLDMTITPIIDLNDRSVKELVIISYDITEKKSSEEKLKVLIERLEYVLKGIDAGIWDWVDINQKFVYWSPKTYELFGYEPGEINPTQTFVEQETHPDDLHLLRQMFYDIIKRKMTPYRGELRLRTKTGEYRWFQTHTFLVTDEFNNPKRLIGSLIDIDEMKKIEGELAEETRKSVQSSKLASIGEIAAGVAHEVNNPLTIIFGYIRMIEEELKSKELNREIVAGAVDTIKQAASRAAKIVTGLRDFSRDGATDPFEEIRVTEVLDMALTLCRERFKKNGVELKLDLRTQKFIHCRRVELSQVFLNLIMNAFDAVKNLESPWIKVMTQDVPDYIEISVTDSGLGIETVIQEKIFQPFFTTKRFGSGTGLGLSIAKSIIATHRGDLFYDPSSLNTRFVVRIPKDFII